MGANHKNGGLLYSRLSDFYDTLYSWFVIPHQKALIRGMQLKPGSRILDVGVGTGLSLPLYPKNCRVTGIDISPRMLSHARRRVKKKRLHHVDIVEMDALEVDRRFAENSFDSIVASFFLTVLPDPVQALKNLKVVGKPGCSIYILNYARGRNALLRSCEKALEPFCLRIGWNYRVDLEETVEQADLTLVGVKPCFSFDPFLIVEAKKERTESLQ